MRYHIENIEDQLVATLKAQSGLNIGVTIRTHMGEVDRQMFMDPAYLQGMIVMLPFVFVEYAGRVTQGYDSDGMYMENIHTLKFRFFVGASTLRTAKEGSRNAYAMLRSVYDAIHGKLPWTSGSTPTVTTDLLGLKIETTGFNACSPFMPAGGSDEQLVVNQPKICIYATEYSLRLLA